jgi:uncharacterized HhH-GPD family protein
VHALCAALVDHHDGDIDGLWRDADAATLGARLRALPGFGDEKARIFIAVLAKKYGIRPQGWEVACAPFGDDQPRTAADIADPESLAAVRAWKKARRAEGKGKAD